MTKDQSYRAKKKKMTFEDRFLRVSNFAGVFFEVLFISGYVNAKGTGNQHQTVDKTRRALRLPILATRQTEVQGFLSRSLHSM